MQSHALKHVPAAERSPRSRGNIWGRIPRWLKILAAVLVAVAILLPVAGLAMGEPMRRSLEARMNRQLKGYSVRIGKLRFQPIGGALTLSNLEVRQLAHPEPALATIPRLRASVQWKELFFLRVVADFQIESPRVHVNLAQLRSEIADGVPVKERGWQQAVQEIYPLKINLLRIHDADITYIDDDPKRPLRLTHLNARASNIRNIHSKKQAYPSPIQVDAVVFESGRGSIRGDADFLSEPHPGVRGQFRLASVPLDRLGPVAQHWNFETRGGVLSTAGEIEYAPGIRRAHVPTLEIRGARADYIPRSAALAKTGLVPAAAKATRTGPATPPWTLQLDRFQLTDSELGYVDKVHTPDYRVFFSQTSGEVTGFSKTAESGTGKAEFRGRFMGNGPATATATFRGGGKDPDFDLRIAIEGTDMTTMNNLFRAYGKFDVFKGTFSLYSEVRVQDGFVSGYVKPLFTDVEVYDSRQDAQKGVLKKVYEGAVDAVAKILENKRDDVATTVELSGPLEGRNSSVLQTVARLIENGLFKAILPGFDRQIPRPTRPPATSPRQ